ncbi:MAG: MliC family protein [Pseudomonadota bacterium]
MTRVVVAAGLLFAASAAVAQPSIETVEFTCERGAWVTATYVGQGADLAIVLMIDGRQVGLPVTRSGSGVRFADPDSGYVWHEKGATAVLLWQQESETQTIYADCRSN